MYYSGLVINVFVVGFSGIIAQTLLVRELLSIFEGNEFSLGIIFANWLLSETLGILFLSKKIEDKKEKVFLFVVIQCLFIISFLFSLIFLRYARIFFNVSVGISFNIFQIVVLSTIVLFLPAFLHGCLYTYSAKLLEDNHQYVLSPISYAYIYELIGTIIGGIVFTFVLLKFFDSFNIIFVVWIINILAGILLSFYEIRDRRTTVLLTSISICIFFSLFTGLPKKFEEKTNSVLWKNYNLVFSKNSIYGKISVTKQEHQYTFYLNSLPVFTIPTADISFVEEFVHIPFSLLENKNKKQVLVLSNGVEGVISEIKKYKNVAIDYVELDPELIKTVIKFVPQELEDVNLYYTDTRYFVNKTQKVYDIIYIGVKEPKDLQINRLFTSEFFKILKNKIDDNGILVFTTPGSLVYLPKDLLVFNKIILETVKKFFNYVKVIPGDEYNIIICSNSEKSFSMNNFSSQSVFEKLNKNNIVTKSLTKVYLEYKLQQSRSQQFLEQLSSIKLDSLNQDHNPQAVVYILRYWVGKVSEGKIGYKFFRFFTEPKKLSFMLILILSVIIVVSIILLVKKNKKWFVLYSILTTGYTGMVLSLILMFVFQIVYGYIYYLIAILTSVFMLGSALGCFLGTKLQHKLSLPLAEGLIIISILVVGLMIKILKMVHNEILLYTLFFSILVFSSMFIGLQIPVFSKILFQENQKLVKTTGIVFAFDTLGGWIGGVLGGMLVFPVLGLKTSLLIIIFLKLISLVFNYAKEKLV
jgi:spermidine synthase